MSERQSNSHLVAKVGEIEEDEAIQVTVGEFVLAIFNHGGSFYATDDTCTHAFASLADGYVEDGCVECPIHAARFEIATGKVVGPPAEEDIKTYPVRVEGEDIYVELPAG
ncbi:MAG: bifunctional 3-phenylpropionate/cinnamic acid dioxygenase ferredoxin subunit [Proteobacteria bacterium]|nr:bifunctional 3-phenylpropionate/cinnamic acid dioxygenase ferredoxin subunit [Pseudomonadota bacterium]MCZ6482415.1 bifunctional 3-phenylpropionate/cinnamic acid dioxygenase ferredoxin subunit [Alphaproteobacteria bacterium]